MNFSVCRNGKLPIGYSSDTFPHFYYHKPKEEFKGVFIELWNSLSDEFGCYGLEMVKYDKQISDGDNSEFYDGALIRGEVFAPVDTVWLRESDIRTYRYSMSFAEARERYVVQTTEFAFYIVFPTDLAIFFLILLLINIVLSFLRSQLRKKSKAKLSWFDLIRGLLFQYALLFVYLTYQGYFRGNSLTASALSPTIYSSIVNDFHAGKRKLVLNENDNYFSPEEIPIILGSSSSIVWEPSPLASLIKVCSDQSLVGLFYETDVYGFYATTLTEDCFLTKVVLPKGLTTQSVWLTHSIREGDMYFYVIDRKTPRMLMEKINWALLTVFTQDNMNGLLRNRNIDTHSFVLASIQEEILAQLEELPPFSPIEFIQIAVPLKILGGGIFLSLLTLLLEIVISRFNISILRFTNVKNSIKDSQC